mgnify:CR=1 FL=1
MERGLAAKASSGWGKFLVLALACVSVGLPKWCRLVGWSPVGVGTVVLAFVPSMGDRYLLFIAYFLVLNVAFAQSWNLVGGYTGLISLGHAAFFGIGAYAAAISIITFELPVIAGFIIGGLPSTAFAF